MSKQPTLYVFKSKDDLAASFLTYIQTAQTNALSRHKKFKIGVSGGSLPTILAQALLAPAAEGTIDWASWEIFFADERAVPLDDDDSNYGLLKKELIDKLPEDSPKPTVIAIDTDLLNDTQELADTYEQELVKSFAAKDSVKHPIFDLLLLGCGPDGHTCSLFPGHELLREDTAWVAPIEDSPKPPSKRITLTLPVISHALKIAFVATGEGKKEIMKTIFEKPEEGLPCSLVNANGGDKVSWFVDEPAVEGVSFPKRSSL